MSAELPGVSLGEFAGRLDGFGPGGLGQECLERLFRHYCELRRWNRRLSLVGPGEAGLAIERHFGESLEGLRLLGEGGGVLVDVGSGAGFPGLVLALARPNIEVTLIEARERKWSFLETVCRKTGLRCNCLNARVGATPVEGLPPEIDWITARAVGIKDLGLSVLVPRLTPRGALLLWVGVDDPVLPSGMRVRREVPLEGSSTRRIVEVVRLARPEALG